MEPTDSLVVAPQDAGSRLDRWLARELRVTRGYVRRLLGRERVLLAGGGSEARVARKGVILRAGDLVQVLEFRHPDLGPPPQPAIELRVLARAEGLIAIDKPAGLPSHPLDYEEHDSALNAVLARHPEMLSVGEGGLRSGLVHRLDTNTSGVLVFALEQAAWQRARAAFDARSVDKRYLARVHGRFAGAEHVGLRLEGRGSRMRVVERGGRESETRLRLLAEEHDTSLLEVRPVTGLRHQIRVTLAHLGHPILGDRLYGSDLELGRQLLHAESIRIGDFSARTPPRWNEVFGLSGAADG